MCSQVYNVRVAAMDDNCTSNESSVEILRTGKDGQESISAEVFCNLNMYILSQSNSVLCSSSAAPCAPSQLNASLNCANNSAVLTWKSSPNAVSYTGKAVSADGHNVTCAAGLDLSCKLVGLQCGKEYNFTVSASDGTCQSPDSKPVIYTTGERK